MSEQYIKDIVSRALDYDVAFRKRYMSQWAGAPYGYNHTLTDPQFEVWFTGMIQKMGPDWTRALPYLKDATLTKDAGMEELRRFQRIAGINNNAGV